MLFDRQFSIAVRPSGSYTFGAKRRESLRLALHFGKASLVEFGQFIADDQRPAQGDDAECRSAEVGHYVQINTVHLMTTVTREGGHPDRERLGGLPASHRR